MKAKDIKNKGVDELRKMVTDKREELRSMRFSIAGSANRNVKHHKMLKKDIARMLTKINMSKE